MNEEKAWNTAYISAVCAMSGVMVQAQELLDGVEDEQAIVAREILQHGLGIRSNISFPNMVKEQIDKPADTTNTRYGAMYYYIRAIIGEAIGLLETCDCKGDAEYERIIYEMLKSAHNKE